MPSDKALDLDPGEVIVANAMSRVLPGGQVVMVNKNATEGFKATCYGCGREALLPFEVPADKTLLCPACQREIVNAL